MGSNDCRTHHNYHRPMRYRRYRRPATRKTAAISGQAPAGLKKGSKLEEKFLWLWKSIGGPELEREMKFIAGRRFRADFAHMKSRCLIEIEGGVFVRGRHLRPMGFIKDCKKYNLANLNGWQVFRLTPPQINAQELEAIRNYIQTKA